MTPLISIAVPCYEMHGKGNLFLNKLLSSVHMQTYKNIQVVVSDHSTTSIIKDEIDLWKDKLNIKYIQNERGRGSSSVNINVAIQNCDGDIIKIIFQDDFISNDKLLEIIATSFYNSDRMWGASACNHTDAEGQNFFHNWLPTYEGFDVTGINKIGAPSLIFLKKEAKELFDENLIWLMDCEYYYRLHKNFGLPFIVSDIMVTVRMWENTVTNTLATKDVRKKEAQYVIIKHEL